MDSIIFFADSELTVGEDRIEKQEDGSKKHIKTGFPKVKKYKNLGEKMEIVGKALSRELGYPHFRIKPRMIQLGYIEARGALNYDDNHKLIQPFAFSRDAWRENEVTFVVKESTSNALYRTSDDFRAVMDSGKFVFADGHIVRNNPRCVTKDGDKLILTEEAAGRVDDCCLRFTRSYVQRDVGDYYLGRMFLDQHLIERIGFYLSDSCKKRLSLKYQQKSALYDIIGASRIGEIQRKPLHQRGGPHHVQASQRPTVSLRVPGDVRGTSPESGK